MTALTSFKTLLSHRFSFSRRCGHPQTALITHRRDHTLASSGTASPFLFTLLVCLLALPAAASDTATPEALQSVLPFLPPWAGKLVAWLGAFRLLMTLVETRLAHVVADMLNEVAASSGGDDDENLRALFSGRRYRTLAFFLRLVGVRLPMLSDLERALRLQREEVQAALQARAVAITQTPNPRAETLQ